MVSSIFSLVDLHKSGWEWFLFTFIVLLAISSVWVLTRQSEKLRGSQIGRMVNNIGIFGSVGLLIFTTYLIIAVRMQNPYSMEVEIATGTIILALANLLSLSSWRTQLVSHIRTLLVVLGDIFIFVLASFQMAYEFPDGIESLVLLAASVFTATAVLSIVRNYPRIKRILIVALLVLILNLVSFVFWREERSFISGNISTIGILLNSLIVLGVILFICGLVRYFGALIKHQEKKFAKWLLLLGTLLVAQMAGIQWFLTETQRPGISSCFPEETLVLTPSGNIPIGSLKAHDIVYAYDTQLATVVQTTVLNVIYKTRTELLTINDNLRVTPEHPMAVISDVNVIWKEAGELTIGECLVSQTGSCVNIHSITHQNLVSPIPVINLSVSAPNNFFVIMSETPVLVHNKQAIPPEMIAQANTYHAFVSEINSKYPWAHMSLENGYYAIRPEGKEEIHFQLFTGPGGEETRIPLEQIKEAIEKTLTASTTPKEVPPELNDDVLLLRKRIENCEITSVITTFGGDQRFATRVELSDGSKFTDVISTAELKELQGILKDKCPFSIRNTHYDYER